MNICYALYVIYVIRYCQSEGNVKCSNYACQACCGSMEQVCVVSSHKKQKTTEESNSRPKPMVSTIHQAIKNKSQVEIQYSGGTHGEEPRLIKPIAWIVYRRSFRAICCISNQEKTFDFEKIRDCQPTKAVTI